MTTPILKVKDLSVSLGKAVILNNISFDLREGESLAIIGPNGSGKTTLLRCLIGQLEYSGSVEWDKKTRMAYVPQKIDLEKKLPLTLKDFLLSKTNFLKKEEGEMKRVLDLVRLSQSLLSTKLGLLSAGQFQKAIIAFALIGDPNVILFDEPTAGVDLPREEQIYDMLHRLQDLHQLTLLIVSHDLSLVFRYATKVLCLNQQMVCYGAPKEILTTDQLHQLYGDRSFYHHFHGWAHSTSSGQMDSPQDGSVNSPQDGSHD